MNHQGSDLLAGLTETEFAENFFRINLQQLFGDRLNPEAIADIAAVAVTNRQHAQTQFEERLGSLLHSPEAHLEPRLLHWPLAAIEDLRGRHGGLLLGLFHFGGHRHVLLDLAVLGVRVVAPIAGHAFAEYEAAGGVAVPDIVDRLRLLPVDSPRVGRELVRELRQGRVGAIYVDGNMGPDGHHVREGGVRVDFMGRPIRVKSGIARLALGLKVPILPLFAVPADADGNAFHVVAGAPVVDHVASDKDRHRAGHGLEGQVMAHLYGQLEAQVQRCPAAWEFALCLHRWSEDGDRLETLASVDELGEAVDGANALLPDDRFSMDRSRVALMRKKEQSVWVDTREQVAYRCPDWSTRMTATLASGGILSVSALQSMVPLNHAGDAVELIKQMARRGLLLREKSHVYG